MIGKQVLSPLFSCCHLSHMLLSIVIKYLFWSEHFNAYELCHLFLPIRLQWFGSEKRFLYYSLFCFSTVESQIYVYMFFATRYPKHL